MGVDGICTNDPRLFEAAEKMPKPEPEPAGKKSD
jgi:aspartokinase